jgi:5-formaminoimidazole-4-carboxamide-1-beta-D-ribofuranosyl 5'-monophosphate synthetase
MLYPDSFHCCIGPPFCLNMTGTEISSLNFQIYEFCFRTLAFRSVERNSKEMSNYVSNSTTRNIFTGRFIMFSVITIFITSNPRDLS